MSLTEALQKLFPGRLVITSTQDQRNTGNFEVTIVKTGELIHSKRNGMGKCEPATEERDALIALIRQKLA